MADANTIKTAFLAFYDVAFDAGGNVLNCGRAVAIQLIEYADKLEPDTSHGNLGNGFMDVNAMRKLHDSLAGDFS